MDNWDPRPVFVEGKYISKDTWFDGEGKPFQPQVHYFVGGATKMYGAALYRLRPQDFGELNHVDGISPAWPLSYDDFEPWYTKAEQLYQVRGNGGEDPTEGHRSAPYPWPAVSHEDRIQELANGLAKGGWRPFHAPCGIMLDESERPRSTCIRCTWCDGYPCLVPAKSDAEVIAVRPVLGEDNITLLTRAEVTVWRPTRRGDASPELSSPATVIAWSTARTSSLSAPAPRTAPRSCSTRPPTPTRGGWRTGRTRWDAITCSTTARPSWRCRRNRTTPCSRRRWASTTSTSPPKTTSGRWVTSR